MSLKWQGGRSRVTNNSSSDHMIVLEAFCSKNVEIAHQNFRSNSNLDNVIAFKGNWVLAEFVMTAVPMGVLSYCKHLCRRWLQVSSLSNTIILQASSMPWIWLDDIYVTSSPFSITPLNKPPIPSRLTLARAIWRSAFQLSPSHRFVYICQPHSICQPLSLFPTILMPLEHQPIEPIQLV